LGGIRLAHDVLALVREEERNGYYMGRVAGKVRGETKNEKRFKLRCYEGRGGGIATRVFGLLLRGKKSGGKKGKSVTARVSRA